MIEKKKKKHFWINTSPNEYNTLQYGTASHNNKISDFTLKKWMIIYIQLTAYGDKVDHPFKNAISVYA